jgi:hypothetical protein
MTVRRSLLAKPYQPVLIGRAEMVAVVVRGVVVLEVSVQRVEELLSP